MKIGPSVPAEAPPYGTGTSEVFSEPKLSNKRKFFYSFGPSSVFELPSLHLRPNLGRFFAQVGSKIDLRRLKTPTWPQLEPSWAQLGLILEPQNPKTPQI